MKCFLAFVFVLIATVAEAACPVGSTCENYNGTIPYTITNPTGTTARTPADRANDHGVNILDFGAVRNNISSDSTAAIQAAIDACYNQNRCREIFCPDGDYAISYPLFLDPPGSLRGGAAWVAGSYSTGDIVNVTGTYYRSTINNNTNTPPGTGWTATPPPIYNRGSTYSIGDTVISSGMMWISLVNSNTGNTPATTSTSWAPTTAKGTKNANWGATFTGNLSGPTQVGTGCRFFVLGGKNFPALWIYGNGMVVDSLQLLQQSSSHRCQLPTNLIGFAVAGGASSLTTVRNSNATSFYAGYLTGADGDPNVADSNYIERSVIQDVCFGAWFPSTQNFLNTMLESQVKDARFNIYAAQNNGINIYGGNYTNGQAAKNTFTIGTVFLNTGGSPYTLTATLSSNGAGTWPDTNLTGSACSSSRSDYPLGCQYDVFVIVTPSFGAIPFLLKNGRFNAATYSGNGFNSGTNVITLQMYQGLMDTWVNSWISDVQSEIQSATTIYATEMGTIFTVCGGDVNDLHIEDFGIPTMVINSLCSFGLRPSWFKNIYLNYESDLVGFANSPATYPVFLVQQTMPLISASNDLHVEGLNAGVALDRVNLWGAADVDITFDRSVVPFNIKTTQCTSQSFSSVNTAGTLSCGIGSRGTGIGRFGESMGGGATTSLSATFADQMRGGVVSPGANLTQTSGFGASPFWGVRPAPWSTPCVTPTQFGNIPPTGSLPSITTTGHGFTGSVTSNVLTVSSSTGLTMGSTVYGVGVGFQFQLGSQIDATHWNANTGGINISSTSMSTVQWAVPYPLLWGGQNYRVCDWYGGFTRSMTIGNSFYSTHKFYSYGQSITSTLNPALAWSIKRKSPTIYLDATTLRLLFPGQILQITCNSITSDEMIVEVNQVLGYARLIDANQDGSPYVTDFGVDCVGGSGSATLTLGQPAYVATQF